MVTRHAVTRRLFKSSLALSCAKEIRHWEEHVTSRLVTVKPVEMKYLVAQHLAVQHVVMHHMVTKHVRMMSVATKHSTTNQSAPAR